MTDSSLRRIDSVSREGWGTPPLGPAFGGKSTTSQWSTSGGLAGLTIRSRTPRGEGKSAERTLGCAVELTGRHLGAPDRNLPGEKIASRRADDPYCIPHAVHYPARTWERTPTHLPILTFFWSQILWSGYTTNLFGYGIHRRE